MVEVVNTTLLSSLGNAGTHLTYDLHFDGLPSWGETRAVVVLPSQGVYWDDLGAVPLTSMTAGAFNRVEFSLPASLRTKLLASYGDLQVRLIVSAPTGTYRLDNLSFGGTGGPPPVTQSSEFTIQVSDGVAPEGMLFATTHELKLNDRVKTFPAPGRPGRRLRDRSAPSASRAP